MTTLALIGTGRFGSRYIETLQSLPQIRLKYICSSNAQKRSLYSKEYSTVGHYTELFQFNDIDGYIIATPASTHFEIAAELIRRGSNILVEKPLTTSYAQAKQLLELWDKTRQVVLVGHIYLFNSAFLKALKLKEKIGDVVSLDFTGSNWGPVRADTSVLWDWSPHDIAMCLTFLKSEPLTVEAWGQSVLTPNSKERTDTIRIRLNYPNNVQVSITNSWLSPEKTRKMVVVGTKASLIFNDLSKPKLSYYSQLGTGNVASSLITPDVGKEAFVDDVQTPLEAQLQEFAACIKTGKDSKSDIAFGVKVIKILHAAEQSLLHEGIKISLADV